MAKAGPGTGRHPGARVHAGDSQPELIDSHGDSPICCSKGTVRRKGDSPIFLRENWDSPHAKIGSPRRSESEAEKILSQRAVELVRAEFEQRTWEAWWKTAVEGRPAADVAAEMGMSLAAVYKAKSRVLLRLRQELAGLQG